MNRETRPLSWRQLWESGFKTEPYEVAGLPTGTRRVRLEASAWNRNLPAVTCFFLDLDSGQRYRVSVFKNPKTQIHGPAGCDFSVLAVGETLTIEIHQNHTGTFRILGAYKDSEGKEDP